MGVEESGPAADAIDALDVGEVVLAPSLADLLRFLVVGEVDAVLVPSTEVPTVVEAVGEVTTLERVPTGDSTVMVMSRGSDEALTALVDEALTAFVDGPQGDGAADRWLGG